MQALFFSSVPLYEVNVAKKAKNDLPGALNQSVVGLQRFRTRRART